MNNTWVCLLFERQGLYFLLSRLETRKDVENGPIGLHVLAFGLPVDDDDDGGKAVSLAA